MKVVIFDSALEKFIESLEKQTIAKVLRSIDLLAEFGNTLEMPHSKHVKGNLFELRVRGKQEVRIFYVFLNLQAVLLHGYIKKSQRVPKQEIDNAISKVKRLTRI